MSYKYEKILVILSGGQDSTTCLFLAKQLAKEVHAITFSYGQRHKLEIEAAEKVAKLAQVASHELVYLPAGVLKSASPLVSSNELEQYESFEQMETVIGDRTELTFVPMRNTLFFTIAINRAIALGTHVLMTGICQEDNANYPDCREEFRATFEKAASLSLGHKIEILAPLMNFSKKQTVELAYTMKDCWYALAYSHTSYDGKYPPTDNNHANVLRAQGFLQANLPDPLVVRAWNEGLMELPNTPNYFPTQDDFSITKGQ